MTRPEFTARPIPVGETLAPLFNGAFNNLLTTALGTLTSDSLNTRDARRIGFFYNISATAGGAVDVTYTLQCSWDDGQAFYNHSGKGSVSAEGSKTEVDVGVGRRYIWWEIAAPIARIRVTTANLGAGDLVSFRDVRLWKQS